MAFAPLVVDLRTMSPADIERIALRFEADGCVVLDGVGESITPLFDEAYRRAFGLSDADFRQLLDPEAPPLRLTTDQRRRIAKIESTAEMKDALLAALGRILARVQGPLVHVSSTFHGQFKSGEAPPVDHGGYGQEHIEVQGQYLLHQDFSGAAVPTSPGGMTLWVALNDCPDWNLRLYPGSHRKGLLCNEWMKNDDPRAARAGEPYDVVAKRGRCVLFHALLLHGSANPGRKRRVSCDLRFFPLCSFLPSEIHAIGPSPLADLRAAAARPDGEILRASKLEAQAFLGLAPGVPAAPRHSVLHWAAMVSELVAGRPARALERIEMMVNREIGIDGAEIYSRKFHDRPMHSAPLARLRERLVILEPDAPELAAIDRRIAAAGRA